MMPDARSSPSGRDVGNSPCTAGIEAPLVTVAIPTYNRAAGLANTIADVQAQSYVHLEILIGDNCSTDPEVVNICALAAASDSRIRVIRQPSNIGASGNFLSLLSAAKGEFFMWAADDDRHAADFVETCLKPFAADHAGNLACVMTGCVVVNYVNHEEFSPAVPNLTQTDTLNACVLKSILCPYPAMIYGLFRRTVLCSVGIESFDWADCYLMTALLSKGYRVETKPQCISYTAGVLSATYTPKPSKPGNRRLFEYKPYLHATLRAIWSSSQFTLITRCRATVAVLLFSVSCFRQWEKKHHPVLWWVHSVVVVPWLVILNKLLNTLWVTPCAGTAPERA
jgi:glycosyltransferase involved in cell wall biosynthesis